MIQQDNKQKFLSCCGKMYRIFERLLESVEQHTYHIIGYYTHLSTVNQYKSQVHSLIKDQVKHF